ncbi:MFS transporter [Nostocoides japonicum]|nr:MFS transporter [Tetrasphaera japonica]
MTLRCLVHWTYDTWLDRLEGMGSTPVLEGASRHAGYLPGTDGYRRVLVALFAAGLATFVLMYDTQAVLTELAASFRLTPEQSTLSVSLTTATLAVALLVAGPLSEIIGRTRLIRFSLIAATIVSALCALAPSWSMLLGLRLLLGVVIAGLPAVATSYLQEELHASAHGRAAGLYVGGTALGGMASRLLTAPVADAVGWRWALAAAAALALVCTVLVLVLLPRSRGFVPAEPRLRSLAGMAGKTLRDPALLALYGVGACGMGATIAVFNALGFRLVAAPFGLDVGFIGLLYLTYVLGSVSSGTAGSLADRWGRRTVIPIACAIALAGVLLTLVPALPAIIAGLALLVIGFFGMHGLASGWVTVRAHAVGVSTGQAAAFYLCAYYLGSSVFGNLGTTAWTRAAWPGVAAVAGVLILAAGVLVRILHRTPSALTVTTHPRPARLPGRPPGPAPR